MAKFTTLAKFFQNDGLNNDGLNDDQADPDASARMVLGPPNGIPAGMFNGTQAGGKSELIKTAAESESKYRKVAKFLILIGRDEASSILSKLDSKQVEAISK